MLLAFVVTTSSANAAITSTLRKGSKGVQVVELQTALGITPADGSFGPKTLIAVKAWQTSKGLVADGVFGAKSLAVLGGGVATGTLPAGCQAGDLFSRTTAQPCTVVTTLPAGCSVGDLFNRNTGLSCTTGIVVTQTGPVTASLAGDNPASGTIVAGQATADLLHVTFTGTGTVNSVTLKRSGISDQSTLSNIYLYDGITRLTDGYSFNNNGDLTMSGLNLAVNGLRTVSVRADVYTSTNSYDISVAMTSYTATGGSAQTVNIRGNDMYIATGANVSTVAFTSNTPPTAPTVNPGTTAYTVWSAPVNVVGTHSLWLKSANFRVIGSAPTDALANVKLYKDGVPLSAIATMTSTNGSNYFTFDFSATPVELTNGNHTMDVRGDVQKGSARTIQLSVQQASDWMVYDSQVGVNVVLGSTSNAGYVSISINAGSLTATIDPTFQSYTKITGGSTGVAIAKFKLHAYGEDMKINTLTFTPTISGTVTSGSTTTLQNVIAYFNGGQVGTQTTTGTSGSPIALTPGSQMVVPAGVDSYLEIRADIRNSTSINYTAGTLHASLVADSTGAEGMSSHNSLAIPGVTGNTLTVQTGTLAVGTNSSYSNQIINQNTSNVKLGSYTLQNQSTSESVRVTSLKVVTSFAVPTFTLASSVLTTGASSSTIKVSSSTSFSAGDVVSIPTSSTAISCTIVSVDSATSMTATCTSAGTGTDGANITNTSKTATAIAYVNGLRTTETSGSGSTPIAPTGTDTFSVDFLLPPGASKTIDIMADLSGANYGTILTTLAVQGIGVSSNVTVFSNGASSLTPVTGQTITMATGTLASPVIVSSNSTTGQYIAAGTTGVTNPVVVSYKLVSSNGNANVTELKFTATGPVTAVSVGGQSGSLAGGVIDITGLSITVPNGSNGIEIPVMISYGSIGAAGIGTATSGTTSTITMSEIDYTIGGTAHTDALTSTPGASPTMKLVGARPSVAVTTATGLNLPNAGEVKLFDVTVTPTGGQITLNSMQFVLTESGISGSPTLSNVRIANGSTSITDFGTAGVCSLANGVWSAGTDTATCTASAGYSLSTAKTFSIYGTVGGTFATSPGATVSVKLGAASTFSWTDATGGATSAQTSNNTAYLNDYPTGTWSLHN